MNKERKPFTNNEKINKNRKTYDRTLCKISEIVNINWNILQINAKFHGVFHSKPMIAYKRSRNLQEIIGGHAVTQGKDF